MKNKKTQTKLPPASQTRTPKPGVCPHFWQTPIFVLVKGAGSPCEADAGVLPR